MMVDDAEGFYRDSLAVLSGADDSRGMHYLMSLLVTHDLLLRILCDPTLDRAQVIRVARAAMRVDSMADVKIVRRLADELETGNAALSIPDAVRLLDILNEVSTGARLLPAMVRIFRHPDPYLRSKAVLFVGRANRSGRWASDRQSDTDPRIRANAIEGLWGVESSAAREMLQAAAQDSNNRVAGNALLGLYQLGDTGSIISVLQMAENASAVFRATAAWVMGQTGDPRFKDALAGMLTDANAMVRRRVLTALKALKNNNSENMTWIVAGRSVPGEPQKLLRRITMAVASVRQQPAAPLVATNFILTEDGKPVTDYTLTERSLGDSVSTIFIFPKMKEEEESPWKAGAITAVPWKRPSDHWAAMHYLLESTGMWSPSQIVEPFRFCSNTEEAIEEVNRMPAKTECADIWRTLWRAVQGDCGPLRGKRNIIVFSHSDHQGAPGNELLFALASRATLQVISTAPSRALEKVCSASNGTFQLAASDAEAAALIANAYLRLLVRYEITYPPVAADAAEVRVRVHHRSGGGETVIRHSNPSQVVS
jgi:hypothetical protein